MGKVLEGRPRVFPSLRKLSAANVLPMPTHSRPLESAMRFLALDLNAWPDHFPLGICRVDRPRQP